MRRYQTNLKKYENGTSDIVATPPPMPAMTDPRAARLKKYHALDADGMARISEQLNDGDVFINKHTPDPSSLKINEVTR